MRARFKAYLRRVDRVLAVGNDDKTFFTSPGYELALLALLLPTCERELSATKRYGECLLSAQVRLL